MLLHVLSLTNEITNVRICSKVRFDTISAIASIVELLFFFLCFEKNCFLHLFESRKSNGLRHLERHSWGKSWKRIVQSRVMKFVWHPPLRSAPRKNGGLRGKRALRWLGQSKILLSSKVDGRLLSGFRDCVDKNAHETNSKYLMVLGSKNEESYYCMQQDFLLIFVFYYRIQFCATKNDEILWSIFDAFFSIYLILWHTIFDAFFSIYLILWLWKSLISVVCTVREWWLFRLILLKNSD